MRSFTVYAMHKPQGKDDKITNGIIDIIKIYRPNCQNEKYCCVKLKYVYDLLIILSLFMHIVKVHLGLVSSREGKYSVYRSYECFNYNFEG